MLHILHLQCTIFSERLDNLKDVIIFRNCSTFKMWNFEILQFLQNVILKRNLLARPWQNGAAKGVAYVKFVVDYALRAINNGRIWSLLLSGCCWKFWFRVAVHKKDALNAK
jgi:hypothetical protein